MAFDVLQQDGVQLLTRPYSKRRALLEQVFTTRALTAPWTLCPMTTDLATAREWLESWTDVSGVEGIVIKPSGVHRALATPCQARTARHFPALREPLAFDGVVDRHIGHLPELLGRPGESGSLQWRNGFLLHARSNKLGGRMRRRVTVPS